MYVTEEIRHLICEVIGAVSDIFIAELFNLRDIFIKDVSCIDLENKCDVLILNLVNLSLWRLAGVGVSAYGCRNILFADTLLKVVDTY